MELSEILSAANKKADKYINVFNEILQNTPVEEHEDFFSVELHFVAAVMGAFMNGMDEWGHRYIETYISQMARIIMKRKQDIVDET